MVSRKFILNWYFNDDDATNDESILDYKVTLTDAVKLNLAFNVFVSLSAAMDILPRTPNTYVNVLDDLLRINNR